jgi:hypothetical protein
LVERNGPRNTRIEISNQSCATGRRLNRSITLSIIDEISCANMEIRAFIVQSSRPSSIRHSAAKIFPRLFPSAADHVVQDDVRCVLVRKFAS